MPAAVRRADGWMRRPFQTGGETGNRRLTSLTGALLLVLLFLEGLTLPLIHRLVQPHIFLGMVLVPPIALKLASTGYRFLMYYGGNARYRAVGPPVLPLRLLGPTLIVATVVLMWSGIELLVLGPNQMGLWKRVHVASFIVWFGLMTIHVLAHLTRAGGDTLAEVAPVQAARLLPVKRWPGTGLRE
ncbi:MAG TPA: hypothetical protein VKY26_10865, partial [Actinomycetota bacterium]|nr:hypothetical protein [Actinomycetota bacterium]